MKTSPKVLIVDDKAENLYVLEKILCALDIDLVKASSGNDALGKVLENEFALLISDVHMPMMDGYEMVSILRQDEKNKLLPVIFISAVYSDDRHLIQGIETGAVDFIIKPIIPEILLGKVNVFLNLYKNKQELLEKAEALKQSNEELEQYAYVVSHDLREPLRGVSSYLNFLRKDYLGILDDNGQMYIKEALQEVMRLNGMIEDILSFSKITKEAGEFHHVKGNDVYSKSLQNLRVAIEESNAQLICDDLPDLQGDENLLILLFQNLIGNAIKYRGTETPIITISVKKKKNEWQFNIADNGIGIHPSKYERIFVIFQRLHHKSEYPGTGIGLSICKKIVEHHHGRIWVEAGKDSGSVFSFTLPIE